MSSRTSINRAVRGKLLVAPFTHGHSIPATQVMPAHPDRPECIDHGDNIHSHKRRHHGGVYAHTHRHPGGALEHNHAARFWREQEHLFEMRMSCPGFENQDAARGGPGLNWRA